MLISLPQSIQTVTLSVKGLCLSMGIFMISFAGAKASEIVNCSGQNIKIETRDFGSQIDAVRMSYLASGLHLKTASNSNKNTMRIYEAGYIDILRATQFNLAQQRIYSIIKTLDGNWKVTLGQAC